MRYERTVESETAFLTHLERMHRASKTMFTSYMLNSTKSFLPSVIDNLLKKEFFVGLSKIKTVEFPSGVINTEAKYNALKILSLLKQQTPVTQDVFTYDNTNTIESYFNVVKGSVPLVLLVCRTSTMR